MRTISLTKTKTKIKIKTKTRFITVMETWIIKMTVTVAMMTVKVK